MNVAIAIVPLSPASGILQAHALPERVQVSRTSDCGRPLLPSALSSRCALMAQIRLRRRVHLGQIGRCHQRTALFQDRNAQRPLSRKHVGRDVLIVPVQPYIDSRCTKP